MKKLHFSVSSKHIAITIIAAIICSQVILGLFKINQIDEANRQSYLMAAQSELEAARAGKVDHVALASAAPSTTQVDPDAILPIEADGSAAMWVDGQRQPMTNAQIAEFEKMLYACKTVEEYKAIMANVAYYSKGVDMSRFPWYWDEMAGIYTAEQIAIMKNGSKVQKVVPDLVGMEMQKAYRLLTDYGFVGRFFYYYSPDSDLPVGYCYSQDLPGGMRTEAPGYITVNVQAPVEITREAVQWFPENINFDIFEYAANLKANGLCPVAAPNVLGLPLAQAMATLESAGFSSIKVLYVWSDRAVTYGNCYEQMTSPGNAAMKSYEFWIRVQCNTANPPLMPNLIGLSETDAKAVIKNSGMNVYVNYVNEPDKTSAAGYCIRQNWSMDPTNFNGCAVIYIQAPTQIETTASSIETTAETSESTIPPTETTTSAAPTESQETAATSDQ